MKATLLLGVASCVVLSGPKEEFEMRRKELERSHVDQLTDMWSSRIDNYDPDLDQEMANDILNNQKRMTQIHRLEEQIKHMHFYVDNDYETKVQMLNTLKEEQAEYVKRAA